MRFIQFEVYFFLSLGLFLPLIYVDTSLQTELVTAFADKFLGHTSLFLQKARNNNCSVGKPIEYRN